jgi:hypothetical protein
VIVSNRFAKRRRKILFSIFMIYFENWKKLEYFPTRAT